MPPASAAPGALGVHDVGGIEELKDASIDLECPPLKYWEFQVAHVPRHMPSARETTQAAVPPWPCWHLQELHCLNAPLCSRRRTRSS